MQKSFKEENMLGKGEMSLLGTLLAFPEELVKVPPYYPYLSEKAINLCQLLIDFNNKHSCLDLVLLRAELPDEIFQELIDYEYHREISSVHISLLLKYIKRHYEEEEIKKTRAEISDKFRAGENVSLELEELQKKEQALDMLPTKAKEPTFQDKVGDVLEDILMKNKQPDRKSVV